MPLLVLDEAHHLKNPQTDLASLFHSPDAKDDADEITGKGGALSGVFERMLFLTATPFQLGHHELCSVLDRFDGVAWDSVDAPSAGRVGFNEHLQGLRERLDAAQHAALSLDTSWGRLRTRDLVASGQFFSDANSWWSAAMQDAELTAAGQAARSAFQLANDRMRSAEESLRPLVLRHLRSRDIDGVPRR